MSLASVLNLLTTRAVRVGLLLAVVTALLWTPGAARADGPLTTRWGPFTGRYGVAAMGVGLEGLTTGTITLDIPATATITQAYLYWSGFDILVGGGDPNILFGRNPNPPTPVTVLEQFGPDFWTSIYYHYVYVADVTSQIDTGVNTYTVADVLFVEPDAVSYGAGLVVVYEDPALPNTLLEIRDGLDAMYFGFIPPIGPNSELSCFQFAADPTNSRIFDYTLVAAGVAAVDRPNALWGLIGSGALPTPNIGADQGLWTWDPANAFQIIVPGQDYPFQDADGDEWDTLTSDETTYITPGGPAAGPLVIPAGAEWVCFQAESVNTLPGLQGASLVWLSTAGGLRQPEASLGDFVWNDLNQNGVQDGGEPGLGGVTVNLIDPSTGGVIATTTTSGGGAYSFTGLTPGSYIVEFVAPGGYTFSPADQGGDATDSDANPATGRTGVITLGSGESNLTVDAGLFLPQTTASVGDFVWNDLNQNGVQDAGEPGLGGVTVNLIDPSTGGVIATTTTNGSGNYAFTGLTPGNYIVEFVAPVGYSFSPADQGGDTTDSDANPATGRTATITLAAGANDPTWDAGLYQPAQPATLGDFVWDDLNQNGVQDAGEPGLSGVTVNLINASTGGVIATTTTDGGGNYAFTGLAPGNYIVEFVPPAGYTFSPADQGGDTTDSDANPASGRTTIITLGAGVNDSTWDAGLYQAGETASLGNQVWSDTNGNGVQDAGEPGIGGVTVNLIDPATSALIASTTTDPNGFYLFSNLTPGPYIVEFVLPSGYTFGPQDSAGNEALDSDADPSTGRTGIITLVAGENNLTIDAGLVPVGGGTPPAESSPEQIAPPVTSLPSTGYAPTGAEDDAGWDEVLLLVSTGVLLLGGLWMVWRRLR